MSNYQPNELRETLKDQGQFADLARFFIDKSSQMHAEEINDARFGEYLKAGLDLLLEENLNLIFKLTESPIETIFVNSLLLNFIKNDPLNLVVQHSVRNAPKQIEAFRNLRVQFNKFISWYRTKHGSLERVEDFLDKQVALGKMDIGEHCYLRRHLAFYEYLGLENRFHMILQPGIPDICIDGRSIRPDLLFWIPSDDSVKVIVECDGYQYHKAKDVFIRDRKRDRALKSKGYEVLRYSGSEIYSDPVAVSVDLAEYLWSREKPTNT